MRAAILLLGCLGILSGQQTSDAMRLLQATACKYRDIGSYESEAVAHRLLDNGSASDAHVRIAYASARMTPPQLPVPMLPQVVSIDGAGRPGDAFLFDQIAWRVAAARISGAETVHSHDCQIVDVQYDGGQRNPDGAPVRYWIEPSTGTIWKMQFAKVSSTGPAGGLARWTVTWESWIENHAPPEWLVEIDGRTFTRARTDRTHRT